MGHKKKLAKGRLDKFYYMAKEQGYRARAAFKLIQLNKKYNFLNNARAVLDLCAAPGSWLQVCSKYCPSSCVMVGVDLDPIKPIRNCQTFIGDITTAKTKSEIKRLFGDISKVDVVLHDGAPNVGTAWTQDAFSQSELVLAALKLGVEFLRAGGTFVTKVFRSADYNALLWIFNQLFKKVEATKPQASRNTSAEIFVVCQNFLAPAKIDPRLLDPKHVFKEIEKPVKAIDVFHDKQKRHRDGYEDGATILFKKTSVKAFIEAEDPVPLLGMYNTFEFDNDSEIYLNHPSTTNEIQELCKDLKVLSKGDFKTLLKWRLIMINELHEKEDEEEEEEEEKRPLNPEEEEGMLQDELETKIEGVKKKKKKVEKKAQEKKKKLQRKIDMKMVIPDDHIDQELEEDELFRLNQLKGKELNTFEAMTAPDIVVDELPEEEDEELKKAKEEEEKELENMDPDAAYELLVERYLDGMYESYLEKKKKRAILSGKSLEDQPTKKGPNLIHDDLSLDELPGAKRQRTETGFVPRVTGNILSDDEEENEVEEEEDENPLILQVEEKPQLSASKRTVAWFSQGTFNSVNEEEDEEADIAWLKQEMERRKKEAQLKKEQKKLQQLENKEEKNGNKEEMEIEESSDEEEADQTKLPYDNFESEEENEDFEEVPMEKEEEEEDYSSDVEDVESKARVLALGTMLVNKKKFREELEDMAYNRYAWNDDELPRWFDDEEKPNRTPQLPLTRAMVESMKLKFKALNARPIKKLAEAKARKKMKLVRKLEKVKEKVEQITDSNDLSVKEKSKAIEKLYKTANKKTKPKTVYMVTNKSGIKRPAKNAPPKEKGTKVKVVDARMKKDLRAKKAAEKKNKSRKRKRSK